MGFCWVEGVEDVLVLVGGVAACVCETDLVMVLVIVVALDEDDLVVRVLCDQWLCDAVTVMVAVSRITSVIVDLFSFWTGEAQAMLSSAAARMLDNFILDVFKVVSRTRLAIVLGWVLKECDKMCVRKEENR